MTSLVLAALLAWQEPAAAGAEAAARITIDSELAAASTWLKEQVAAYAETDGKSGLAPATAAYYRFFTTYALPDTKIALGDEDEDDPAAPRHTYRSAAPAALSFVLNSLAFKDVDGPSVPVRPVSPTLYAIDLRDYSWSAEQWAVATATDPYADPRITAPNLGDAGLTAHGRFLVRADWFLVHATDSAKQLDVGLKVDDVISYALIYGVGKAPKTLKEFQDTWGVDVTLANDRKADFSTVVDKGRSGVSRGVRRIIGLRTVLGDYWETRDARNIDYTEDFLSADFEAGEAITNNSRGLQVYLLFNKDQKRVDSGAIELVVDNTDPHDYRVRTLSSCIACHPLGINPASNALVDVAVLGPKLNIAYFDKAKLIERLYFAGRFDTTTTAANIRYAAAVKACNGLEPTPNAIAFKTLYDWYAYRAVDPEQAGRELGLTAEAYQTVIKAATTSRLQALHRGGRAVPRQFWEAYVIKGKLTPGAYAESVLHIKGRTADPIVVPVVPVVPDVAPVKVIVTIATHLMAGPKVLAELPVGAVCDYVATKDQWLHVRHGMISGYVRRAHARLEPPVKDE